MADDSLGTGIGSVVFTQGLGGTQKADSFLDIPSPFRALLTNPWVVFWSGRETWGRDATVD